MTVWAFVLTPLLVLPIVLLLRFIGCRSFDPEPAPPETPKAPRYRDLIMGEDDIIA